MGRRTKNGNGSNGPPRPRHAGGRPCEFKEEYIEQARVACSEMGATIEQLAELFSCAIQTLYTWGRRYPEFMDAIKSGQDYWNNLRIERSLLERAMGYEYEEVSRKNTVIKTRRGDTPIPAEEITRTKKKTAPDTTAIMFWLQNRDPERWKNVRRVEAQVSGKVTHEHEVVDLSKLSEKELEELESTLGKAKVEVDAKQPRFDPRAMGSARN